MIEDRLGLYIHWPYCARICPYCDFNVYKAAHADPEGLYQALLADLNVWRTRTGPRSLSSIHFGGGTPSLMEPRLVAGLIERAERLFGFEADIEIGLEANPAEAHRLEGLAAAGIERLSLGVQALDDVSLKALGRDHTARAGLDAFDLARGLFDRVSFDLIYARAGQSPTDWHSELAQALTLQPDHMSLYQLTIEPGTAFERQVQRGTLIPPAEDEAAQMFEITQALTRAAGLPAYEVSNHARDRFHQSAHNRLYWEGADWIGIGPGAHSRLGRADKDGRQGASAERRPARYIEAVAADGAHRFEALSARDEAVERVLMGVRLVHDGLSPHSITTMTGISLDADEVDRLLAQGLIARRADRIHLTETGHRYADHVAERLAPT